MFDLPWAGSNLSIADGDDFGEKLGDFLAFAFFNALPLLGAVLVLLVGLYLARPRKGARAPKINAPFVFAFFGFGMIVVGMGGNLLSAIDDLALRGTVFEEGTLVYVAYGAALAALGGLVYWWPKLTGRTVATAKALPLALLGVLATVLASFPHYIAGFLNQEAGPVYGDSDLQLWNVLVLVGHGLMALTVLALAGLLVQAAFGGGDSAGDDPYDGHTLEWATTSPAPADNFAEVPTVMSAEPLLDLKGSSYDGSDA